MIGQTDMSKQTNLFRLGPHNFGSDEEFVQELKISRILRFCSKRNRRSVRRLKQKQETNKQKQNKTKANC